MSGTPMACRECGTPSTPGDQFCGTCGAFLEWSAEAIDAAAPTIDAEAPTAAIDGAGAASAPSAPSSSATPPQPSPGGVTCRACGRDNPAGRSFCQSCGAALKAATPPETTGTGKAAKAPAAPTAAGPAAGTRRAAPTQGGGGIPGWLPMMLLAGLLAGVIVVGAMLLIGSPSAPSQATFAPSVPTLTPTTGPGSGEPPTMPPSTALPPVPAAGEPRAGPLTAPAAARGGRAVRDAGPAGR